MKYPKVTVQIINFNGGENILLCLTKVFEMDYPSFDVLVIDNGSTDGSKEKIKKEFKKVRLVENSKNLGSVKAHNQGFRLATGEFILGLDDDAVVSKNLLKKLVKVALSNKKIGIVVPKVYYYKTPTVFNSTGFFLNPLTGKMNDLGIGKEDVGQLDFQREIDYVPSAIILIKRELIKKVGLMDESYFVYYEDSDWCLRIRKAGYKIIYTPTAKAWHNCKTQNDLSTFRVYHYTRGKNLFMVQNNSLFNKIAYLLFVLFVYSPARISLFVLKQKYSFIPYYLVGLYDGIFNRPYREL